MLNKEKSELEKINETNELRLKKLEEWEEELSKENQ